MKLQWPSAVTVSRWYVEMTIEQEVSYGLDFAFEFALTNPLRTPSTADNAADLGFGFVDCMQQLV